MNIVLFGNTGQLGYELSALLNTQNNLGNNIISCPDRSINVNNHTAVNNYLECVKPDLIINCTGYNDVDGAETDTKMAMDVNVEAVKNIGIEAAKHKALVIHYSTNFVFDGKTSVDYTEMAKPNPISVYGQSKLLGENVLLDTNPKSIILRTSWLYSMRRNNFVKKILKLAREQEFFSVVDDQVANPTLAQDLAVATCKIIRKLQHMSTKEAESVYGIYNACNYGKCSKYDLAKYIVSNDICSYEHVVSNIVPVKSEQFPTAAKRPKFSALYTGKFAEKFGISLPSWKTSLSKELYYYGLTKQIKRMEQ